MPREPPAGMSPKRHTALSPLNAEHRPLLGVMETGITPVGRSIPTRATPIGPSPSFRSEKCVL